MLSAASYDSASNSDEILADFVKSVHTDMFILLLCKNIQKYSNGDIV